LSEDFLINAMVNIPELTKGGLHEFIDQFQISLGRIHEQIAAAYFAH